MDFNISQLSFPNEKSLLLKPYRRQNEDLVKDYICGNQNCQQTYATNAALYTHIQSKHGGKQPQGTYRPVDDSSLGQKGRPQQTQIQDQKEVVYQEIKFPLTPNKIKSMNILKDTQNIELLHLIGLYGDIKNSNIFSRHCQEEFAEFTQNDIYQSFNTLKAHFGQNDIKVNRQLVDFMTVTKYYWQQSVIEQLYSVLLFVLLYNGGKAKQFIQFIKSPQNIGPFDNFNEIITIKGEEQFQLFLSNTFQFIREQ